MSRQIIFSLVFGLLLGSAVTAALLTNSANSAPVSPAIKPRQLDVQWWPRDKFDILSITKLMRDCENRGEQFIQFVAFQGPVRTGNPEAPEAVAMAIFAKPPE